MLHSDLKEIFPNIFFVMGTNITTHEGIQLQHSRNMVVVKNGNELSLINTVQLSENVLQTLERLGKVTNVIWRLKCWICLSGSILGLDPERQIRVLQ